MKKFGKSLYVAALAALALTACENNEPSVTGPQTGSWDGQVVFSSNIRKQQQTTESRVDGSNWESNDQIGLYMIKEGEALSQNAVVGGNENRRYLVKPLAADDPTVGRLNPYLLSEAIYYPLEDPGHLLKFVAYHPYSNQMDEDFNIPVRITDNKPVMYAESDGNPWYDYLTYDGVTPSVEMRFEHKMARITLNIIPGDGFEFSELNTMTIDFLNAKAAGVYNLVSGQFDENQTEIGDAAFILKRDTENLTTTATLIMIPNNENMSGRSIVFTHHYTHRPSGEALDTYPIIYEIPDDMLFLEGKEYIYNATVNRDKVTIGPCQIEDWDPVNGENDMPGEVETLGVRKLKLSQNNPNSYVWGRNGILSIPVIKAYGMWLYNDVMGDYGENEYLLELGTQGVAEPVIIWGDHESVSMYNLQIANPLNGYNATLEINYKGANSEPVVPMNMVVGLRLDGQIRWSWHIWVVDPNDNPLNNALAHDIDGEDDGMPVGYDPGIPESDPDAPEYNETLYPMTKTADVTFMDRNLGALNKTTANPGSMGLYFQWGRKDPFAGVTDFTGTTYTPLYTVVDGTTQLINPILEGLIEQITAPVSDLADIVTQPWAFTTGDNLWTSSVDEPQLWGATKTPWDPCPDGWKVPSIIGGQTMVDGGMSPWRNYMATPASTDVTEYILADPVQDFATQYGWDFNRVDNAGAANEAEVYNIGYYPAAGQRNPTNGQAESIGTAGYYWMTNEVPSSPGSHYIFHFTGNLIETSNSSNPNAFGNPVRCVKAD